MPISTRRFADLIAAWWLGFPDANLHLADALVQHGHHKVAAMVRAGMLNREGKDVDISIDLGKLVDAAIYRTNGHKTSHILHNAIIVRRRQTSTK